MPPRRARRTSAPHPSAVDPSGRCAACSCSGPTANVGTDKSYITALLSLPRRVSFRLTHAVTSLPLSGVSTVAAASPPADSAWEMKHTAHPAAWPIETHVRSVSVCVALSRLAGAWLVTHRYMVAEFIQHLVAALLCPFVEEFVGLHHDKATIARVCSCLRRN